MRRSTKPNTHAAVFLCALCRSKYVTMAIAGANVFLSSRDRTSLPKQLRVYVFWPPPPLAPLSLSLSLFARAQTHTAKCAHTSTYHMKHQWSDVAACCVNSSGRLMATRSQDRALLMGMCPNSRHQIAPTPRCTSASTRRCQERASQFVCTEARGAAVELTSQARAVLTSSFLVKSFRHT